MGELICCDRIWKKYRALNHRPSLKETILGKTKKFDTECKILEDFWVLKDISFAAEKGEGVGILGKNGAGKSTLLRIIASILTPTRGSVKVEGKICPVLSLGAGFQNEFTGEENVYLTAALLGMKMEKIRKNFNKILEFSGVGDFIRIPVKHYSTGMLARLAFSAAVHVDSDIFLIDEALSVGDIGFQDQCMKKLAELKKEGKTLILVSHAPDQLLTLCERSLLIHDHALFAQGKTSEVISIYKKTLQMGEMMDPQET
jgi:ABC-type polysaccharide/polyol phosphate transport system ATPase subunit